MPEGLAFQKRLAPLLPGQSRAARLYRRVVRWLARAGWKFPKETVTVILDPANPLVRLVRTLAKSSHPPLLLPGNPHGAAPRLVLIALNNTVSPVAVLKAGQTREARNLVRREYQFLDSLPATKGIPRVLGFVDESDCTAFAMEYAAGESPRWPAEPAVLSAQLTPWLDRSRTLTIGQLPLWENFVATLDRSSVPRPDWLTAMAALPVHPCLFHGDLAPWNVRETPDGSWTVIDWERGERDGIPGWDWLHFVVQPAILVKKWSGDRILALARETVESREFQTYLANAFPDAPSKPAESLLRTYFLFNWFVLQPTEGRAVQAELAKWGKEKS